MVKHMYGALPNCISYFELQMSPKVKCDGSVGLLIYYSYSNYYIFPNSDPLRYTTLQNLSGHHFDI